MGTRAEAFLRFTVLEGWKVWVSRTSGVLDAGGGIGLLAQLSWMLQTLWNMGQSLTFLAAASLKL